MAGLREEVLAGLGLLHWRPVDAAGDLEAASLVEGFQRPEFPVYKRGVLGARDAHVDFGLREIGDNVGPRAPADHTWIEGNSALDVDEGGKPVNLFREFDNRACTGRKVDARMGGAPLYRNRIVADAFPLGFRTAVRTL